MKKFFVFIALIIGCAASAQSPVYKEVAATLKPLILKEAAWAMQQKPETVTASHCERSTGGKHDFYSEGDYWWPDPKNPNGPYIQRDGLTNPDNFVKHRLAMIRFSRIVGALASAYKITGDKKYVTQALVHIKAWFVDTSTMMNPNLQYAQAIKGVATGRGIGIIDTIQLLDVIYGLMAMENGKAIDAETLEKIKAWFRQYELWLTTHQYGKDEMNAKNNHGTCWVMQTAAFAKFTKNDTLLAFCRDRYKNVLLPNQMEQDGSFPLELKRTKPFGYALFNLDAMSTTCQILSDKKDNLWNYKTNDGRYMEKGIAFMHPFIADKNKWTYPKDVMYWDNWPVAQPALLFGAIAYNNKTWLATWEKLDHDPQVEEVIRNLPVRHPILYIN